jgi:predicted aminopeptidase
MRSELSLPLVLASLALASLVGCGGCSPGYVTRSAWEEARILWRREPIAELLERPGLDGETRAKLETVLAARRFARDALGLEVGGAYMSFSHVPPGALLHVVSAAERTRLEPYTWWFPIVGSVTYKGYFEPLDADEEARRLGDRGYDTYVRPSVAFSTLGWLDDPVLSSWLVSDRVRLVELVLHELLHRTTYVAGQTSFNESFANFVGHRGAIAFFAATDGNGAETTVRARSAWNAELAASERLMRAIEALRELYAAAGRESRPVDVVLAERRTVFAELGDPAVINNAVILARSAYEDRLGWFESVGRGSDLRVAIARIADAAEERSGDPWAALQGLVPPEPPETAAGGA